jgi:hypothetical protein
MKKLALVFALMMLIPCSAFGMQMLNNSSMDQITGQSGVSIAFDDVQVFLHIDKIAYIDSDGVAASVAPSTAGLGTTAGAVGINNFTLNLLNVNAIVGTGAATATNGYATTAGQHGGNMVLASSGVIPLFYNYATSASSAAYLNGAGTMSYGLQSSVYLNPTTGAPSAAIEPRFLTIDVSGNLPCATAAIQYLTGSATATLGGVVIGIPTMEVYINNMIITPYYTSLVNGNLTPAANDIVAGADYGTIQMQGITFTTLSGWVEIAPH